MLQQGNGRLVFRGDLEFAMDRVRLFFSCGYNGSPRPSSQSPSLAVSDSPDPWVGCP
jgi:hypothetical protein